MAHDVFVSYWSKDKSIGDAVSVALESHGLSCWIAPRDILPSNDWGGSIIEAIEDARVMVLIFSASANASVQIKREVERAVTKGKPIIPFRIENVAPTASLEYFISTPQWLDAFTLPLERHLEYLAKVVRKIVGGPEISISPLVPETEPREKAEAEEARIAEEKRKVAEAAEAARLAKEKRKAEDREKKEAAERAKLAEEKQKAAEAARSAEEKRKVEEEARVAEEERKAEEAERARLADEKKKAAKAVEAEKAAEVQRKATLGKIAATDPIKKRAAVISKLASAVSTQLIQHPRLFVVSIVVLLCLGGAAAWYFIAGKQLLTLRGHSKWVSSVAFSPDGNRIVTGSDDATAKVWDAQSGKELLTLSGHAGPVYSVAFSPDGTRIVTGNDDKTAKVWNAQSGKELLTLEGHPDHVYSVAFSPDGTRIVGSSYKTVKVWDAQSGQELLTLKGRGWMAGYYYTTEDFHSVAFSPDGRRIVTVGSYDETAKVWDAKSGKDLLTLRGKPGRSVAFSPDGRRIVTGVDSTAKVWDAQGGKELFTLRVGSPVNSVVFSPDGTRIVTGSDDGKARVWRADNR